MASKTQTEIEDPTPIKISISDGNGYDEEEIDSWDDAEQAAQDWADGGDWGEGQCYIDVTVRELGGEERRERFSILVGDAPVEPECDESSIGHDWQSPYEVVGGCRENPGTWAGQGTQVNSLEVCAYCGMFRRTIGESTPGQYPRTPEIVTYEPATEESQAWAKEQRGEEQADQEARVELWSLDTGNDGDDEDGLEGSEDQVRQDIMAHHGLEEWPSHWTLTRQDW